MRAAAAQHALGRPQVQAIASRPLEEVLRLHLTGGWAEIKPGRGHAILHDDVTRCMGRTQRSDAFTSGLPGFAI